MRTQTLARPVTPIFRHALRGRHHVVAPALRIGDAPAAAVFAAARRRGEPPLRWLDAGLGGLAGGVIGARLGVL